MKRIDLPAQPDRFDIERRRLAEKDIRPIADETWAELLEWRSPEEYRVKIPFFSTHVTLTMPEGKLETPEPSFFPYLMRVLTLHYLCHHDSSYPSGTWVPYGELPDGLFYAATLEQNYALVAQRYGVSKETLQEFDDICRRLGGSPCPGGDRAFILAPYPKTPLTVIVYRGDDEFPPRCRVLLDARTTSFLDIDFAKLLVVATLGVITALGKKPPGGNA